MLVYSFCIIFNVVSDVIVCLYDPSKVWGRKIVVLAIIQSGKYVTKCDVCVS
jgi:hypothetical protein